MLKICNNGHFTGTRNCAYCGYAVPASNRVVFPSIGGALDKRLKRKIAHESHQANNRKAKV